MTVVSHLLPPSFVLLAGHSSRFGLLLHSISWRVFTHLLLALSLTTASASALVASEAPQMPAPTKRARLNPARRKASKAKASQQEPLAEPSKVVPLARTNTKPLISRVNVEAQTPKAQTPEAQTPEARDPSHLIPLASRKMSEPVRSPQARNLHQNANSDRASAKSNSQVSRASKPQTTPDGFVALAAPALTTGGLIGCAASAAILTGVHLWHNFSGAEQAILAARSARLCVDNFTDELVASQKAGTYNADEALDVLRRTTLAYASSIPGGASTVEMIFREIDMVRKQRGQEVNGVLAETHAQLSRSRARGASAMEMRDIVLLNIVKLSGFAGRSVQDVVTRNPQLKPCQDGGAKSLQGQPDKKIPTVRLNMAVRQTSATSR